MQRLCVLLTMGACLVASAPDVAVTVRRGGFQLNLTSSELTKLHRCMCTYAHIGCELTEANAIRTRLQASQNIRSTQYLNAYICTLFGFYVKCARNTQNGQTRVDVQRKSNVFSLHNTETCDISCVDVMWDDSVTNVKFYSNKTSAELCSVKPLPGPPTTTHTTPGKSLPGPPTTTHTTPVIIISIMVASIVLNITSAIIIIYVCVTRKRQPKNRSVNIPHVYNCLDVNTSNGLYDVSSEPPREPDLEREQGPLYHEIN